MYHLLLCKGLSYRGMGGAVTATRQRPDVYIEDKAGAEALAASGFFELIGEAEAPGGAPGHLDPEQLESMTLKALKTLAAQMGVDVKGLDKPGVIKAITETEAHAPAFDAEALAAMSDEELKAFAVEKGVDLTGCEAREDMLEAISAALGGSYTMLDLMRE